MISNCSLVKQVGASC